MTDDDRPVFRPPPGYEGPIQVRPEWEPNAWDRLLSQVVFGPRIGASIREHIGDDPWFQVPVVHPSNEELVNAVQDCPVIPRDLRQAVALRFSTPPKGRPRKGESAAELAEALRSLHDLGISRDGIEYVAGRLNGSIRRPRARPEKDPTWRMEQWYQLKNRLRLLHAAVRMQRIRLQGTPAETALFLLAREECKSPHTLAEILNRRFPGYDKYKDRNPTRQKALFELPLNEVEELVQKMVRAGSVRLDPERGILWISPTTSKSPKSQT